MDSTTFGSTSIARCDRIKTQTGLPFAVIFGNSHSVKVTQFFFFLFISFVLTLVTFLTRWLKLVQSLALTQSSQVAHFSCVLFILRDCRQLGIFALLKIRKRKYFELLLHINSTWISPPYNLFSKLLKCLC